MSCDHCKNPIPVSTDEDIQFPVLSCKHILCGKCIAFALITTKFSFNNIESIILTCPICTQGIITLPLRTIKQLITIQKVEKMCPKHSLPATLYCLKCRLWLCLECKKLFHRSIFSSHKILTQELAKPYNCSEHNKLLDSFCIKCNNEICNECNCNKVHKNSIIQSTEQLNNEKSSFINKLSFKKFDECNVMIEAIEEQMKNFVEDIDNSLNQKIDDIIMKLIGLKELITKRKMLEIETYNLKFDLFKECYKIYYNELYKDNLNLKDLNILKKLNVMFESVNINDKHQNVFMEQLEKSIQSLNVDMLTECEFVFKEIESNNNEIINKNENQNKKTKNDLNETENIINKDEIQNDKERKDEVECNNVHKENNENIKQTTEIIKVIQPVEENKLNNNLTEVENNVQPSLQLKHTLKTPHSEFITCSLKISNDYLVSTGTDKMLNIYKKNISSYNYECECSFAITKDNLQSSIRCMCFIDESLTLVVGCSNGTIHFYSFPNTELIHSFDTKTNLCIRHICKLNKDTIITCGDDTKINILNINTYEYTYTYECHTDTVNSVIILNNTNNKLVSASEDCNLIIWNLSQSLRDKYVKLKGHEKGVLCLCEITGDVVISGGKDGNIKFWDLKNESCIFTFKNAHNNWVCCLYDLTNNLIASGGRDNLIKIWNTKTSECISIYKGHINSILQIYTEINNDKSQNNKYLISVSPDNTIKTWEI